MIVSGRLGTTDMPQSVFRNNLAIFGWGFMGIWMAMLCLMTWLFFRDGGFHQFDPLIETSIMLLFWFFGLAGSAELFVVPRVRVTVKDGEVTVREDLIWRGKTQRMVVASVAPPRIRDGKDSEGDPYFQGQITLPDGRHVTFAESHDRSRVEDACARLEAALKAA